MNDRLMAANELAVLKAQMPDLAETLYIARYPDRFHAVQIHKAIETLMQRQWVLPEGLIKRARQLGLDLMFKGYTGFRWLAESVDAPHWYVGTARRPLVSLVSCARTWDSKEECQAFCDAHALEMEVEVHSKPVWIDTGVLG